MNETEIRSYANHIAQSGSRTIGGIATRYGAKSRPMARSMIGQFIEVFEVRAWAKSLGDGMPDVRATYEHGGDLLGTTAAGTLRFADNATALSWECDLPNTRGGDDCLEHVRIGNVRGSSVEFVCYDHTYEYRSDMPIRRIHSAKLVGISATCAPQYPDSTVTLRSLTYGLARQFSADPDEVADLVAAGEVRSLFQRTDIGPAVPTPVEVRGGAVGDDLDLRRRRLNLRAKQIAADTEPVDGDLDLRRRRLELHRRKAAMDGCPIESRSLNGRGEPWDVCGEAWDAPSRWTL